ncbi:hypothetical protein BU25DRAFT_423442 [Macroventuria anomochaeta]|uniref:Uncharacterized protein n=1 Tax=Macroventuria anomochaeta TaxID=301207 RepID=A0ACB6RUG0_9PLEO|nr:uncharacterized protein BU25DRAFT_423442 [Macroventuria anomochaeta]KAF2625378.1 hypothetical protein BU25DRAFT_423442 [Macroventuria anomochaeta]
MAVLDDCPGLVLDILVDNVSLPEYQDNPQPIASGTIAKFVEAESGKEFEVRYTFTEPPSSYEGTLCEMQLGNNSYVARHILNNPNWKRLWRALSTVDSTRFTQSFYFKDLTTPGSSPPTSDSIEEEAVINVTVDGVNGGRKYSES